MSVFSDFDWSWRGIRVRETGAEIAFDAALLKDIWRGGQYIVHEKLRRPPPALPIAIDYDPRAPRPWYLLWGTLRQAGLTQASAKSSSAQEDEKSRLTVHFADVTTSEPKIADGPTLNGDCIDISKSHVATTFQAIFGYSLALDPAQATGPYLEKGEENGIHDAQIHNTPRPAEPGRVYQKLIDNKTPDGTVLDYRSPTVFGEIPLIFLKERPVGQRFDNLNTRVRVATPQDCFSPEELSLIKRFCKAMNLDWGGLDILRDAADGRIYIVDVNKTDMGPPLSLPIKDKLSAVKTLGLALRDALIDRL